jgi:hypothetical protein
MGTRTTATKATPAVKVSTSTTTATKVENLVRLTPKAQKAVKALAQAHAVEKEIAEQVKSARQVILDEVDFSTTTIGTDAKGKRLVKVQVIEPKSAKYDTTALVAYLAKTNPEVLEMFAQPLGEPTKRVLTL